MQLLRELIKVCMDAVFEKIQGKMSPDIIETSETEYIEWCEEEEPPLKMSTHESRIFQDSPAFFDSSLYVRPENQPDSEKTQENVDSCSKSYWFW